jgi:RND family efflux transporter MFP subunit
MRPILLSLLFLSALALACSRPQELSQEPPELPVRLEVAARSPFRPALALLGVVRPAATAEVTLPSPGRLRYPGRFRDGLAAGAAVAAGEELARLVTPEAELVLGEARLKVESTQAEYDRYRRAFEGGVVPAALVANYRVEAELARRRLAAAEKQTARLTLRAPVAGLLVVERRIPAGAELAGGTLLARIAAARRLTVEARAAAADRPLLHAGLPARFLAPGAARPAGAGAVREIAPVVDAGGTLVVGIEVLDANGLPAPGEGVEVRLALEPRDRALAVPEEALVTSEGGSAVYVADRRFGKLVAHRRPVATGARGDGRIEVLGGLSPGERVVVDGAALLSDGAPVVEVQAPAPSAPPAGEAR